MIALLAFAAAALAPDGQAAYGRPPAHRAQANLASYISDMDYPAEAIRRHEQGAVAFALDVDTSGRVGACRITASSGSATLDETTCRILSERAQFTPARDRRGRPVPDQISSRIRWVLPDDDASSRARTNLASYISDSDYPGAAIRAREQGTVGFLLDIGPDGLVSDCHILNSSGSASLDEATCRIMRVRPRFRPARDSAGNPVADHMKARIRWVLPPPEMFDLSYVISSADYPAEAIRRHEAGRVEVEFALTSDGRVSRCLVKRSSGSALLDARTCDLIRARVVFGPEEGASRPDDWGMMDGFVDWILPPPR